LNGPEDTAPACAGKRDFIGFSVHNGASPGSSSKPCVEKFFFNEPPTFLWDGVQRSWRRKKLALSDQQSAFSSFKADR